MKKLPTLLAALVLAAALTLAVDAPPAHAAIVVNETADELNADGDCSLAEAVQALNTAAAVDACPAPADSTITLPAGTYDVGAGVVTMTTAAFVGAGAGATVLDCSAAPVCINNSGAGSDLDLSSLTMTDALGHHVNHLLGAGRLSATDTVFDTSGAAALRAPEVITLVRSKVLDSGGIGVYTNEGVFLIDSEVIGSTSFGVAVEDGPVELQRSTVAESGGGGVATDEGPIAVLDSTVRNNAVDGLRSDSGEIKVVNSTLSRNGGHGLATVDGALLIDSSTIAENTFRAFSWSGNGSAFVVNSILANAIEECDNPSMVSGGYNITNDDLTIGCNFDQPTDQIDVDPQLAALDDNGGPTFTQLPQAGSPAIDRGGECPGADQRGAPRPVDGDDSGSVVCDVGAVEVQPDDPAGSGEVGGESGASGTNGSARPARALPLTPAFTG